MKPATFVTTAIVAAFCAFHPALPGAESPADVVAHDLQKLRVPGKVQAVLWTRRDDHYSLQVVFPREYRMRLESPGAAAQPYPRVYLWLLKGDGTVIAPGSRLAVSPSLQANAMSRIASDPRDRMEVMYRFSLEAGGEAVAAAIRVDDEYLIEQIKPL